MVTQTQRVVLSSIVLVVLLSGFTFAIDNHVRWNNNLNECVYFYEVDDETTAHCYVDENECEKHGRDTYKDVDASTCYHIPRIYQDAPSGCQQFVEGDLIILEFEGTDPDVNIGPAGELIYTVGEPFDQDGRWQTDRGDEGTYTVSVTVSDGEFEDVDSVCFDILPGNNAPEVAVSDVEVDEGQTVKLDVKCTDEDNDQVTVTFSGAMSTDTWNTGYEDAGVYAVTVRCSDGELTDSASVEVTINDVDRAPTLSGLNDITVHETETVYLRPDCADPEGGSVTLTYTGDMTSDTWPTGYSDAGEYSVTATCEDESGFQVEETISVTVLDKNRPPIITAAVVRG